MDELEKIKNELSIYKSFVSKAFNKTETEINELVLDDSEAVKDSAFENLLSLDTSKVKKIKGDGQAMFDKGYQKAEAEVKTKVEKVFKEKTGFSGDYENTEELFDAFIVENSTKSKSKLTDDDVKKHPVYIALEKERVPKADHEKVVSEFEQYKTSVARNEKLLGVKSKVKALLDTINLAPIENPTVKNKRLEIFLKEFEEYDYEFDGDNIVIIKDGKRLEDDHGNMIPFNKLVSDKAGEHFEILKQPPKWGAGNSNPNGGGGNGGKITIKDEADYLAKMQDIDNREAKERDPAKIIEIKKERIETGKAWMEQTKS